MGSIYSRFNAPTNASSGSVTEIITGRKRKHDEIDTGGDNSVSNAVGKSLNTPIR